MLLSVEDKRALFRSLHESHCFVLARPRNVGGLRRVEGLGAKAIETTTMGFSGWSDRTEYQVLGRQSLPHLARVCGDTDLPVSADLHEAAAQDLRGWADCVRASIKAGVAGLSIADGAGDSRTPSSSLIDRVRVAREVISASEQDIVVQVSCEGLMAGTDRADILTERLRDLASAGADVFSTPGTRNPSMIKAVVDAVSPRAVSVLLHDSTVNLKSLCGLGVRRINLGFTFGADGWSGFERGYATVLSRAASALQSGRSPTLGE